MVHTRFEVTILEPLIEIEALAVVMAAENKKWDINLNERIIVIEGPKSIKVVIKFLAYLGLSSDVGLIRKIVEYDPDDYEKEFMEYTDKDDQL